MVLRRNNEHKNQIIVHIDFVDSKLVIAIIILSISVAGSIALSIFVICMVDEGNRFDAVQYVFSAVLPLLGTWVGTILAYYFSKENFELANRSVQEMAKQMTPIQKLKSIPVRDKMIHKSNMIKLNVTSANPLNKILIVGHILKTLKDAKRNRLPILDRNGFPLYIIHRSMIDKYLANLSIVDKLSYAELEAKTLEDLLNEDSEMKNLFETSWVTVSDKMNLSDAKEEMDQVTDCSDVFITKKRDKE